MRPFALALLVLALPLSAHDEDPAKVPTRPEVPPEEVAGAVVIISFKDAPKALPGVERSREEARARAEEALDAARAHDASFDDVVAKFSDDPGNRGRMGTLARGKSDYPALEEALFGMEVGQVSDILEFDFGFLIAARMTARTPAAHILVSYRGSEAAPTTVTRSREEARALAEEAHRRVTEGKEDFVAVAGQASDCPSHSDGGNLGEIARGKMPPAFEDAAFSLPPGGISGVVETEYGFHVILHATVHWHASHILIMHAGSEGAPPTIARTRDEAKARAEALLESLRAGEDFAKLAASSSDCPSKARGGDLGGFVRGQRDPAFEAAVAAIKVGGLTGVVETPAGFHLIRRTE